MSLINCENHGHNGIEHVCIHVDKAFQSKGNIEFFPIEDDIFGILWLCPNCVVSFEKIESDKEYEKFYSSLEPCCISCFKEWMEEIKA
ncbi:MAG TPA: hypothetical protein VF941_23995 [Clostridia bacterium]